MTLIEKLEASTEGSRELDTEILASLGTHILEKRQRDQKAWWYKIYGERYERLDPNPYTHRHSSVPRYTTSIDAALTLVPEDWAWHVQKIDASDYERSSARVWIPSIRAHRMRGPKMLPKEEFREEAATPALALCIAALKARGET